MRVEGRRRPKGKPRERGGDIRALQAVTPIIYNRSHFFFLSISLLLLNLIPQSSRPPVSRSSMRWRPWRGGKEPERRVFFSKKEKLVQLDRRRTCRFPLFSLNSKFPLSFFHTIHELKTGMTATRSFLLSASLCTSTEASAGRRKVRKEIEEVQGRFGNLHFSLGGPATDFFSLLRLLNLFKKTKKLDNIRFVGPRPGPRFRGDALGRPRLGQDSRDDPFSGGGCCR